MAAVVNELLAAGGGEGGQPLYPKNNTFYLDPP